MRYVLALMSLPPALFGGLVFMHAQGTQSAIHEIEALLFMLGGAVLFSAAVITGKLDRLANK
jgi:hypothetical protein